MPVSAGRLAVRAVECHLRVSGECATERALSLTCTREPTGSATARSLCRATPPLSGAGDMVLPVRTTACRPRLTASTTPQHSARAITLLATSGGGELVMRCLAPEVPHLCRPIWGRAIIERVGADEMIISIEYFSTHRVHVLTM